MFQPVDKSTVIFVVNLDNNPLLYTPKKDKGKRIKFRGPMKFEFYQRRVERVSYTKIMFISNTQND